MNITKNNYSVIDLVVKSGCSCLSCPCNGKSSKTADGASGSQNDAGKEKKLNNPSGCS
jgi:hypothetical protein